MNIKDVCVSRRIRTVETQTPLLVPSFSSSVREDVGKIYENLQDYLYQVSLVSAYDIHYDYYENANIWPSSIVFLDSGNYEKRYWDGIKTDRSTVWSYELYLKVIEKLGSLNDFVLVNYDEIQPLKAQIKNAKNLFSNYPKYAACFLCKPTPNSMNQIDIAGLQRNLTSIEHLDILGLTEKELGVSLFNRCSNILKIRKFLLSLNIEIPIHIFGCLDPISIISYFLCGADIFDGLSWLKYSFQNRTAIYINNHALLQGNWSMTDPSINMHVSASNLIELNSLQNQMRHFTRVHDLDKLKFPEEVISKVKTLSNEVGIDF